MKRYVVASFFVLACSMSAFAAPITYNVNHTIGAGSVVGTIETDGTLGTLTTANILDWTLTLSSPNLAVGSPDVINAASGNWAAVGSALTATAADLFFDFGSGPDWYLVFQSGVTGNAWCMTTGPTSCSFEPTPSDGIYFGTTAAWAELRNPSSSEVIASVPEPGVLALLAVAVAGLGFSRRRKLR